MLYLSYENKLTQFNIILLYVQFKCENRFTIKIYFIIIYNFALGTIT